MKIAIIGTGIAGNVAAYHLSKQHQVTVFESNAYVGGHTHTHDIHWQGVDYAIDTGFIVFNQRTYPNFIKLLKTLDVRFEKTDMSFSVKNSQSGLEYNGRSLNALFAQRSNIVKPGFYRMITDILRFNREALVALEHGIGEISLGCFLRKGRYSKQFVSQYIVPMGAAIWSTDPQLMLDFPAEFFIRFFHHHGLLTVMNQPQWYVIKGGSREYLRPLIKPFKENIRLGSAVRSISRDANKVQIQVQGQPIETFDAVFIATHSDQALNLLSDASDNERSVLGAIKYQRNEAILHVDHTVLPTRRRAWGAWNYHLAEGQSQVALSYNMNILQNIEAPVPFCVTLNSSGAIDPSKIIKRLNYEHPLFTTAGVAAQQRQVEINGVQNTYYCGAYWRNGFHEDGVVSALNAIKHFEDRQAISGSSLISSTLSAASTGAGQSKQSKPEFEYA